MFNESWIKKVLRNVCTHEIVIDFQIKKSHYIKNNNDSKTQLDVAICIKHFTIYNGVLPFSIPQNQHLAQFPKTAIQKKTPE